MDKNKKNKKWIWIIVGVILSLLIVGWCVYCELKSNNSNTNEFTINFFKLGEIGPLLIGVFVIAVLGYLLGRISVKGVSLGTAGVFLIAILFGFLFTQPFLKDTPFLNNFYIENTSSNLSIYYSSIIQNTGLVLFITSVGFVAGPTFFSNIKKRGKVLFFLVLSISLTSALLTVGFALIPGVSPLFAVGVMAGANTTTPGFSSALEVARQLGQSTDLIILGYAVAYPFGVILIVLFVQVLPKLLKTNVKEEVKEIIQTEEVSEIDGKKPFKIDHYGFASFAFAVVAGILVGSIRIPLTPKGFDGACFSLGITGGTLLVAVLMGHFKKIGNLSITVNDTTSASLREFGLLLFLIGSGVSGGVALVDQINTHSGLIILYGAIAALIIALMPLLVGFVFSKYVLKLKVVESLGYITGGRTSTPALGLLISKTKSKDVASLYAATYPIALIFVVLIPQIILNIFL